MVQLRLKLKLKIMEENKDNEKSKKENKSPAKAKKIGHTEYAPVSPILGNDYLKYSGQYIGSDRPGHITLTGMDLDANGLTANQGATKGYFASKNNFVINPDLISPSDYNYGILSDSAKFGTADYLKTFATDSPGFAKVDPSLVNGAGFIANNASPFLTSQILGNEVTLPNYAANLLNPGVIDYDISKYLHVATPTPEKGMTKEEAEDFKKEVMEAANNAVAEEANKAIKKYFSDAAKEQELQSQQLITKENKILLERAFKLKPKPNEKDWREWRCVGCGDFLDRLETIPQIEEYLQKFKVNDFKKCKHRRHANAFAIQNGEIKLIIVSSKKIPT